MNTNEIKELFARLYQGTTQRKYSWTPVNDNQLRVDFPNSSIILSRVFFQTGQTSHQLNIVSSAGNTVAIVKQKDVELAVENGAAVFKQLYEIANDQAYKISDTIKNVLENL